MDCTHTRFALILTVAWEMHLQHWENATSGHGKSLGHQEIVLNGPGTHHQQCAIVPQMFLLFKNSTPSTMAAGCRVIKPGPVSQSSRLFRWCSTGFSSGQRTHLNRTDFGISSSLSSVCCQFCVAKFLALIGLFNWFFQQVELWPLWCNQT